MSLIAPAAFGAGPTTPEQLGELFCKASLSDEMALLDSTRTPMLALAIAEAEAKNAQIQASFPDEKPPLGDGLPWRSWQDFADGCAVGNTYWSADRVFVEVNYSFAEAPDANYTDQLVLTRSVENQDIFQLDDIALSAGMTMRSFLASAFALEPKK
ncbi:MAG: hypothetical protein EON56_05605 [Alphaproteobacteria bacterium]|nr:MAG: hypothetical protein EON56_05605 [Alphaproteobacteria bacterium]